MSDDDTVEVVIFPVAASTKREKFHRVPATHVFALINVERKEFSDADEIVTR
jgi:hypothetical protein